jgi:hypothetical protein
MKFNDLKALHGYWQQNQVEQERQSVALEAIADRLLKTEIAARWQWMCDLLDGQEVDEFALSFPEVRKLDDIMSEWRGVNP